MTSQNCLFLVQAMFSTTLTLSGDKVMRPKGREDSYTLARQSSADPDGMCHKSPAQQQTGITEQLLTEVECSHSKFLKRKSTCRKCRPRVCFFHGRIICMKPLLVGQRLPQSGVLSRRAGRCGGRSAWEGRPAVSARLGG